MYEKKMANDNVLWIRMNSCTVAALVALPLLVFMFYAMMFTEFSMFLKNNGNDSLIKEDIYGLENCNKRGNIDTNSKINDEHDVNLLSNYNTDIDNNDTDDDPQVTLVYRIIRIILIPLGSNEVNESVEDSNNEVDYHKKGETGNDYESTLDRIALPLPEKKLVKDATQQTDGNDKVLMNKADIPMDSIIFSGIPREPLLVTDSTSQIKDIPKSVKDASTETDNVSKKINSSSANLETEQKIVKDTSEDSQTEAITVKDGSTNVETGPKNNDFSTDSKVSQIIVDNSGNLENKPKTSKDASTQTENINETNTDNLKQNTDLMQKDDTSDKQNVHDSIIKRDLKKIGSDKDKKDDDNSVILKGDEDLYLVTFFWDFTIPNALTCPYNGSDLYLLIIIHTYVKNFEQRKAIRETWGKLAKMDGIAYIFILGIVLDKNLNNKLKHESDTYQDIVMTDLSDTEKNDVAKSVISLKWIKRYCPDVKYVFKTDDNVFVNLPYLSVFLQDEKTKDDSMYGYLYNNFTPEREPGKKNYVSKRQFKPDVYPNYLAKEGYIFPGKFVPDLYKIAIETPYINQENIFITGIVADKLNIPRIDVPLFSLTAPDLPRKDECTIFAYGIVYHPVTSQQLRFFWNQLKVSGFRCGSFLYYAGKMIPKDKRLYSDNNEKILYPLLASDTSGEHDIIKN